MFYSSYEMLFSTLILPTRVQSQSSNRNSQLQISQDKNQTKFKTKATK